jgi:hypothetical protein
MLAGIANKDGVDVAFLTRYTLASSLAPPLCQQLAFQPQERELVFMIEEEEQLAGQELAKFSRRIEVLSAKQWDVAGTHRRCNNFFCRSAVLKGTVYPMDRIHPHPVDAFPFDDSKVREAEARGIPILRVPIVNYGDKFRALSKVWYNVHGGYFWFANWAYHEPETLDDIMTLCTFFLFPAVPLSLLERALPSCAQSFAV